MTRIAKYLITGLLALPALVSCEMLEPFLEVMFEPAEPSYLSIDGRTLCDAFDTSFTFDISCDISFSAEIQSATWAAITSAERNSDRTGGTVSLRFQPNLAEDARTGEIVIRAGSKVERKEFKQFGIADFFSPRSISLNAITPSVTLTFTSPKPWTAKISEGQDWFSIGSTSGTAGKAEILVRPLDENENTGSREGSIIISIDGNDFTIPVTQGQKDAIHPEADGYYTVDWKGGELALGVLFNIDYDVQVSESWIHHVSTKSLSEATEMFIVDENPGETSRSAVITFTGKGKAGVKANATVEQSGLDNVLRQNVPGMYGIDGESFLLGTGGWNHSGLVTGKDGSIEYRLMNPESLSVISVTGIKPPLETGNEYSAHVVRRVKKNVILLEDYPVTLLGESDGMLWFKNSKETYFIIQK